MKSKLLNNIEWSTWKKDTVTGYQCTYLHTWRELTHPCNHKVEIYKYFKHGKVEYEAYCFAGKYGETCYIREKFNTAKDARYYAELAALAAIKENDLYY